MTKFSKQEIEALLNLALSKNPDNWLLFKCYPMEAKNQAFQMLESVKLEVLQIREDGYYEFYLGLGMSFKIDWIEDRWFDGWYSAGLVIGNQKNSGITFNELNCHESELKKIYQEIKKQYTSQKPTFTTWRNLFTTCRKWTT